MMNSKIHVGIIGSSGISLAQEGEYAGQPEQPRRFAFFELTAGKAYASRWRHPTIKRK